ncbi:MAG: hypothetical protein AUK63_2392, partial [bacterium P3]
MLQIIHQATVVTVLDEGEQIVFYRGARILGIGIHN